MALAVQQSYRDESPVDMAWLTDRTLIESNKVGGFSTKLE
jgi:hypothetical protein